MVLAATHLVAQPGKSEHPYSVTLDMKDISEKLFDKGPCLLSNIGQVVAKLKAHMYKFATYIKKHF